MAESVSLELERREWRQQRPLKRPVIHVPEEEVILAESPKRPRRQTSRETGEEAGTERGRAIGKEGVIPLTDTEQTGDGERERHGHPEEGERLEPGEGMSEGIEGESEEDKERGKDRDLDKDGEGAREAEKEREKERESVLGNIIEVDINGREEDGETGREREQEEEKGREEGREKDGEGERGGRIGGDNDNEEGMKEADRLGGHRGHEDTEAKGNESTGSQSEGQSATPGMDSGTPGMDSGTPGIDSETAGIDSETPGIDSGTPVMDSGTLVGKDDGGNGMNQPGLTDPPALYSQHQDDPWEKDKEGDMEREGMEEEEQGEELVRAFEPRLDAAGRASPYEPVSGDTTPTCSTGGGAASSDAGHEAAGGESKGHDGGVGEVTDEDLRGNDFEVLVDRDLERKPLGLGEDDFDNTGPDNINLKDADLASPDLDNAGSDGIGKSLLQKSIESPSLVDDLSDLDDDDQHRRSTAHARHGDQLDTDPVPPDNEPDVEDAGLDSTPLGRGHRHGPEAGAHHPDSEVSDPEGSSARTLPEDDPTLEEDTGMDQAPHKRRHHKHGLDTDQVPSDNEPDVEDAGLDTTPQGRGHRHAHHPDPEVSDPEGSSARTLPEDDPTLEEDTGMDQAPHKRRHHKHGLDTDPDHEISEPVERGESGSRGHAAGQPVSETEPALEDIAIDDVPHKRPDHKHGHGSDPDPEVSEPGDDSLDGGGEFALMGPKPTHRLDPDHWPIHDLDLTVAVGRDDNGEAQEDSAKPYGIGLQPKAGPGHGDQLRHEPSGSPPKSGDDGSVAARSGLGPLVEGGRDPLEARDKHDGLEPGVGKQEEDLRGQGDGGETPTVGEILGGLVPKETSGRLSTGDDQDLLKDLGVLGPGEETKGLKGNERFQGEGDEPDGGGDFALMRHKHRIPKSPHPGGLGPEIIAMRAEPQRTTPPRSPCDSSEPDLGKGGVGVGPGMSSQLVDPDEHDHGKRGAGKQLEGAPRGDKDDWGMEPFTPPPRDDWGMQPFTPVNEQPEQQDQPKQPTGPVSPVTEPDQVTQPDKFVPPDVIPPPSTRGDLNQPLPPVSPGVHSGGAGGPGHHSTGVVTTQPASYGLPIDEEMGGPAEEGIGGPGVETEEDRTASRLRLAETNSLIQRDGWTTGLFGCGSDCGDVCYALGCCRYSVHDLAVRMDPRNSLRFDIPCCHKCYVSELRTTLRNNYSISGTDGRDCCAAWWCTPCAVAQMMRELDARIDPSVLLKQDK